MSSAASTNSAPPRRRWLSGGACITVVVFAVGRLALEPLRDKPQFDDRGMEAFSATETFMLRKDPTPVRIAFFGSSQSVWAIVGEDVAHDLGEDPAHVRNLAVEGGTPFDMWNLIRRNEDKLKSLRLAIVEVNPFVLRHGLDSDPRVTVDVAQHGTVSERLMLAHRADRVKQLAEWLLPIQSVRRSLESAFLNVVDPEPGLAIYPCPEQRTHPAVGWRVDGNRHVKKERLTLDPTLAAKRMVGAWRLSKLQDHALRRSLEWFAGHGVPVVFHELPVHPEVVQAIHHDPAFERGHEEFLGYVNSLQPPPVARIYTPDPADCGISEEQMADRTHLNELGAHLYSHHIAAKIRETVQRLPGH